MFVLLLCIVCYSIVYYSIVYYLKFNFFFIFPPFDPFVSKLVSMHFYEHHYKHHQKHMKNTCSTYKKQKKNTNFGV
jgi:hypothetical protein